MTHCQGALEQEATTAAKLACVLLRRRAKCILENGLVLDIMVY